MSECEQGGFSSRAAQALTEARERGRERWSERASERERERESKKWKVQGSRVIGRLRPYGHRLAKQAGGGCRRGCNIVEATGGVEGREREGGEEERAAERRKERE